MHIPRKTTKSYDEANRVSMIRSALLEWGKKHQDSFPWRATRIDFTLLSPR
jgi:adenine-specific DNA glycosylase